MDAKSPRWRQITPSQFAWEADALDYLRERLPDRDPYRAWANLEFTSREGRVYEVDALVITPNGIFLIEIKSTPGTVSGDSATWRWTNDRGTSTRDNPLRLANHKSKVLKGLIEQSGPWRQKRLAPIFIEPLVFLSAPALVSKLSADGRVNVVSLDPPPGQPGAGPGVKGIDEYFRSYSPPQRHHRPGTDVSRALADALEAVGVRESQRSRQVGGWVMDPQAIDEGPDYQDFVGHHRTLDMVRRRIRIFPTPANMGRDRRELITRAIRREFELLSELNHPSIDAPKELEDHELGPALVYDPGAQPLDLYMTERGGALAVDTQLHLLRQISETIAYAHSRRLVHRALTPRSIMVLDPAAVTPRIKVLNWQTVRRLSDHPDSRSSSETTLSIADHIDARAAAFVAPDFFTGTQMGGELLDVFSLGALAFLIFAGRAAAGSQGTDDLGVLRALGEASLVSRPEVLSRTWTDAAPALQAVRNAPWQIMENAASLGTVDAIALGEDVKTALRADQLAQPIAPALHSLVNRASSILARQTRPAPAQAPSAPAPVDPAVPPVLGSPGHGSPVLVSPDGGAPIVAQPVAPHSGSGTVVHANLTVDEALQVLAGLDASTARVTLQIDEG